MRLLRSHRVLSTLLLTGGGAATSYRLLLSKQQQQDAQGFLNSSLSAVQASTTISTCVIDYLYSLHGIPYDSEHYHKIRSEVHTRTAEKILRLSVKNRGIYFKVGQYIGNLERIIPHEFTDVLKVLQDSAPPLPFHQIRIALDTDLGEKTKEFAWIEEEAIAAASLAQVHKGELRTGETVAIKIQYPFLQVQTRSDFRVIRWIVRACNQLLKWEKYEDLNFLQLWETFYEMCSKELDFSNEMQNAEQCRSDFQGVPQVYIPKVKFI